MPSSPIEPPKSDAAKQFAPSAAQAGIFADLSSPAGIPRLLDLLGGHATLRVLVAGGLGFLLAVLGDLCFSLSPWNALALPGGLAVAVIWRWGPASLVGVCVGLALALLWLQWTPGTALVASLGIAGAALTARACLSRLRFDYRLERAGDLLALGTTIVAAAALPLAAAAAIWLAVLRKSGPAAVDHLASGWLVMSLGMLLTAVLLFAFERSLLLAAQRGTPSMRTLTGGLVILLLLVVLSLATPAYPGMAAIALFAPHVVVIGLVLRGQFSLASMALFAAGLLVTFTSSGTADLLGPVLSQKPALAAWMGSALLLMLFTHATMVEWRGRSQRWEWALDGSRLGVADWHLQSEHSFASSAWRAMTGHVGKAWTPAAWLSVVHPEDRTAVNQAIGTLTSGEVGRSTLEWRTPVIGGWRWLEVTMMVIERDPSGAPLRLLATLADVQERRDSEERQLMSVSLFQHLHEGLLITDADLRVLDVNAAYLQILGVTREEIMGTVPSLLRPAPSDPVARQQRATMWATLRDAGSWRGELMELRRNGRSCTLQTTISTVRGPTQDLRYHVLVISDITEQHLQREQLERQAHFDELTRLPNRTRLSQLLDDAMQAADRDGYLLVVCYLDLDRFKPVNDRYGHAAGDRLLSDLAGRLRTALRSREQWTDSAARLGGDEFVLLLRAGTLEEARLAVERVLRVVSMPYLIDATNEAVQITASMGATVYPIDRSDADTLLRHADNAMYGAKQSGRNGYLFFDPEHRRRTEQRVMAIGRIQEALDQQEFLLHYQPKVDMKSGRVLGFEALLRWEHPEQGLIAPLEFLPLIENTGLSSRVGDWVISQALEHLSQWRRKGLDFSVSVNVSARHLQEPDFAMRLSELLARHPEPLATRLELEMLETAAHADIEATSALVARCQGIGVKFALDDFGTGYSTLTYLKRLPVDVLKIDRSFVHHMLDDTQDLAIVEGVISLARTFGCTVVAEGVEFPAQARTLLELGCEIGQGTGIAAPMPAAEVAQWVREYRGMFALSPAEGAPPEPRLA